MTSKPRVWISNREPQVGEVVTVRAMVSHAMETGFRKSPAGEIIPRNIINRFECSFDGQTIFAGDLDTAVSRNPFIEFKFNVPGAGQLQMAWSDDEGQRIDAALEIATS